MRRFLHGLLVGVLTLWIPLDSAVAGWWLHHHRHAMPVAWGPAFPPPCDVAAPFPGWAGAIVIDDRPLGAPSPFAVVIAPPAEMVLDSWVTTGPVGESIVEEGTTVENGSIVAEDCACDPCQGATTADTGTVFEGTAIATEAPGALGEVIVNESPTPAEPPLTESRGRISTGRPVESTPRTEPHPETESPTPLELPNAATTTTSGDAATAAQPSPAEAPSSSVLEPWEPKTVQGDSAADTESARVGETQAEVPAAIEDDNAAAFETPAVDEAVEDAPASPPKRRNLFDEVPADDADAFESPRGSDDTGIPADDFDPPADAGFEAPTDEPMDDEPMTEESATDEEGFESSPEEPMEDLPADEPATEETPAENDPFDSGALHIPGQPSRTWRDDTGRHSTAGRLVEVRADSVRILKVTGRHTTVPMSRLSAADREHVAGIALATRRRTDRTGDTAGL